MSKGEHVKQEDFDLIWAVKRKHADWTNAQIAEVVGRSNNTVSRVLGCNTLKEYDVLKKHLHQPKKEHKKAEEQKVEEVKTPLSENYQCNRIHEQLKQQNEKLAVMTEYLRDCARILNEVKTMLT